MLNLQKTITITTTILFIVLSSNAIAINKCVSPSGQTTFTDKPCQAGSTSEKVKVRTEHHKSDAKPKTGSNLSIVNDRTVQTKSKRQSGKSEGWKKRWPTLQAYKEYYCKHEAGKTKTPAEMIANAKAVSSGDIPSGTVCCMNNNPVACK